MKNKLKVSKWVFVGILLLICGLFLDFYLPHAIRVKLTGTEIKRMDGGPKDKSLGVPTSRDVRFIIGIDLDANKSVVFRNEDTGWNWPPYFKFNSGSVDAHAVNIVKATPDATVLVKYYGWRMGMFSLFPNAISLKVVEDGYSHFPVFNTIFFVLLLGLSGFVYYRFRRWRKRRAGKQDQQLDSGMNTET